MYVSSGLLHAGLTSGAHARREFSGFSEFTQGGQRLAFLNPPFLEQAQALPDRFDLGFVSQTEEFEQLGCPRLVLAGTYHRLSDIGLGKETAAFEQFEHIPSAVHWLRRLRL